MGEGEGRLLFPAQSAKNELNIQIRQCVLPIIQVKLLHVHVHVPHGCPTSVRIFIITGWLVA